MFNFEPWDGNSQKEKNALYVIFFWAQWHPDVISLAESFSGVDQDCSESLHFYQVDIDKNEDIASLYEIKVVPTVLFLKEGRVLNSLSKSINQEVIFDIIKRNL